MNDRATRVNFAIPLGGVSTDIYMPSLPAMANYFYSTNMLVQLTITFFALGLGVGQIFSGPISDAVGRKKIFTFGLVLQLFSLLVIVLSYGINGLVVARFFQGLGVAFMMVPSRAMLNDVFEGDSLRKQYTYMTASFALGPIVAPFIGGYLQHYFGWVSNFYFIMGYVGILLMVAVFFLKETIQQKKTFSLEHMRQSYAIVLRNKFFMASGILVGIFMALIAVFNVAAPFLIQILLGKSSVFYGYIALFMGAAWFLGNMISRLFSNVSILKKSIFSFVVMIVVSFIMLSLSFTCLDIYSLILPASILLFFGGFLFPIYIGECLSLFRAQAASANGLLFAFIWIIFSAFSFIGTFLKASSFVPIASCYLAMSLCLFSWFLLVVRNKA